MAELGKAYVQIVPSARGISGSISKALNGESVAAGTSSGASLGKSLVSSLTGVIAAAGIGKVIASSISEGAALQQSIGGIETLFKDNADQVIQYANEAYKTAGLSANDYMETVTSFSASLLQSLGGDTKKAGEAANQAVIDMSDNANKMGTSMESIQNAYQGFAKGNYTMLDNLKLGYGGTKEEMERLLQKANEINAENGKMTDYSIDNFADISEAIHVVQEDLGIAGATASEAATTFSGSFASMKSAADNLLGAIALGDDISDEIKALADTVKTFVVDNFLPMVGNILKSIPDIVTQAIPLIGDAAGELMQWFSENITSKAPELLETAGVVIQSFLDGITEKLPDLLDKGVEMIKNLADGALENLPAIITAIGDILNSFVEFIITNLPTILEKGSELITYLANGISENLPAILSAIGQVLMQLLQTIISHLPQILQAGIQLIQSLASGVTQMTGAAVNAAGSVATAALQKLLGFVGQMLSAGVSWITNVISGIVSMVGNLTSTMASAASSAFSSFTADWSSIGSNIISGIVSGVTSAASSLYNTLKDIASSALDAAKSLLKIGSPSKLFRDEVGKWIPEGIAVGIDMNADAVDEAVAGLANPLAFDTSAYMPSDVAIPRTGDSALAGNWTINIYPSAGMDEKKLADYVADSINKQIRRKGAAFA